MAKKSKVDDIKQEYVTTEGAGKLLGVTKYTIRKWIKEGKLPAKKMGGIYFLRIDDIRKAFSDNKAGEK